MAELITFNCSKCRAPPEGWRGKGRAQGQVPKCSQPLTVPAQTDAVEDIHKKESEEEVTGYGLVDEPVHIAPKVDLTKPIGGGDDDDDDDDKAKRPKEGKGPKGQKREKAVKKRTLLEPELWQPVKLGLKIIGAGYGIWIFVQLLHLLPFIIISCQVIFPPLFGNPEGELKPQYAAMVTRYEINKDEPQSPDYLGKTAFAVGLITGVDLLNVGLWISASRRFSCCS